jgi:hypothetical protein
MIKGAELEPGDDPERSIPFDYNVICRTELDPLAAEIAAWMLGLEGFRRARPSSLEKATHAIDLVLQNLVTALATSRHCFLAVSRDRSFYSKTRYRPVPVSYDWLIRVLDLLRFFDPPLILTRKAFNDPETGIGRRTRIKASPHLMALLQRYSVVDQTKSSITLRGIEKNLPSFPLSEPVNIPTSWTRTKRSVELIQLKNSDRVFIDYEDNDYTKQMRTRLQAWNNFAHENFHVDLLLTDSKIEALFSGMDHVELDSYSFYSDDRDRPRFVRFGNRQLYRVFNNSSFDEGGRFYGGWWQQIPSKYRPYITINEGPTREFDFSNLHAAMLYAMDGLPLKEDAYVLPGLGSHRKLVKTTFFKMMNAREGQKIDPPLPGALPPNVSWEQLQQMILEMHAPIANRLRSGEGIRMQKLDADIAEDVMLRKPRKPA